MRIPTSDDVPSTLHEPPPIDRLVVCHEDAWAPNTLTGDDAEWTAHVDLGALGLAHRWADIAVAAMSTEWNYGPGLSALCSTPTASLHIRSA